MLKTLRILLVLTWFICCWHTLSGQNYFVSNLYNNLVFSNPSIASFNNYSLIQLNYRNQWPVDGLYSTYGAAYFHDAQNLNSNFGLILNRDNIYNGVFNTTSAGINYSFKLKVGYRNYLLFGLNGSYTIQNSNYNRLTFEFPVTNMPGIENNHFPVFNSGISLLLATNHLIGASVVNIYPFDNSPILNREINMSYLGRLKFKSYNYAPFYIEPLVNIRLSENYIYSLYGCNLEMFNFKTGILLSQSNFQVNSFAILLGILIDNYDFIYSYDLNLSGAISINPKMAAHEVTFLRKFQYKGRRKQHGAIKCPKL